MIAQCVGWFPCQLNGPWQSSGRLLDPQVLEPNLTPLHPITSIMIRLQEGIMFLVGNELGASL